MLGKIQGIIDDKKLLNSGDSVLIACSGGVDSMVLLNVMHNLGYSISVAHINYGMRAADSEADEALVRHISHSIGATCHVAHFPEHLKNYKNFQQEARVFRYAYFEQLCAENDYQKIATAHHMDDEIETFFIHLFRASGINGLSGIEANVSNKIIRPFLELSKKEIYDFAHQHHITYREDMSNFENKYLRNKIRNLLVPTLTEIDHLSLSHISQSIQHLKESAELLAWLARSADYIQYNDHYITIDSEKLLSNNHGAGLLYYVCRDYGFNRQQTDSVFYSDNISAHAISSSHVLIKERKHYLIKLLTESEIFEEHINTIGQYSINGLIIDLSIIETKDIAFEKGTEYLSFEQWPFPLTLRSRKPGDTFKPLGMNGRNKMLKKFIIDEKLNSLQKNELIIFEYKNDICYVAPFRISEAYKLKPTNPYILKIVIKTCCN